MKYWSLATLAFTASGGCLSAALAPAEPRLPDGTGAVTITGDRRQWHKITLTLDGPFAAESDRDPNPFRDYRMTVTFRHVSGSSEYQVPGYFAADGNAAHSSAEAGTRWRAHLSPDRPGRWTYQVSFVQGDDVALDPGNGGLPLTPFDGQSGAFVVRPANRRSRGFHGRGRLQYVGRHHLRFAGTGEYFLKAGADAPETLLAYADFDGTEARRPQVPLKTWQPHLRDWRRGDPTWKGGKGRGLIGALNYLAGKGCNAFSFLTYNAGGDGDNVWPFTSRDDKFHYDCSKLDQWGLVFDHAQQLGLYLHFKLQETENDDHRVGKGNPGHVPTSLDGGDLGPERRLYLRELIARFGHALALNWNLGEENTQSPEQQREMAAYLRAVDPYDHPIVVHSYPDRQDQVYPPLLGNQSVLTGASLQNGWHHTHERTLKWLRESAGAGRPWVVANDEQGSSETGVPPDPGYAGFDGRAPHGSGFYDLHDIRKYTLWGNLMAGGAGVEYYFGYRLLQNDLVCEDFRSRDRSWDYCRIALDFFRRYRVPFWEMTSGNALVGNPGGTNSRFCLALPGQLYLIYLPEGGSTELDLSAARGRFRVSWFNPRQGGPLRAGTVRRVTGGQRIALGHPPVERDEDWLAVVRR